VANGATGRYLRGVSREPDLFSARHWRHGDDARNKPNSQSYRDHDYSGVQHGAPQGAGREKDSLAISRGEVMRVKAEANIRAREPQQQRRPGLEE